MGEEPLSLNKAECTEVAEDGGFQPDSVEKVSYLLAALTAINEDNFLSGRLVLKGGTALNLFHFALPRLSVDIDLNYIGSTDPKVMDKERTEIETTLKTACRKVNLNLQLGPSDYANRGYKALYKSAFAKNGQIKIDINYLHRVCLWQPEPMDSFALGKMQATQIPVISLYELAAGKLCALLARSASRDLFDVQELSAKIASTDGKLRLAYLFYAAKQPKNWLSVSENDIRLKPDDVKTQLFPMLSAAECKSMGAPEDCAEKLIRSCKGYIQPLLALTENDKKFINGIWNDGKVDGSLITDDVILQGKIGADPGILFRCSKAEIARATPIQRIETVTKKKEWDPRNLTERMTNALDTLATSTESLQKRLEYAAKQLDALDYKEFPEPVQREFQQIFVLLTNTKTRSTRGTLADTTAEMSDDDAKELIERIVHFCVQTWELLGTQSS